MEDLPIKEIKELLQTYPWIAAILGVVVIAIIVILIKERKLKLVITDIVKNIVEEERKKGVTVEIVVDDLKAKAIAKVKEKPDKTDAILLWLLNSKIVRLRVIGIITKVIEKITDETPEETLTVDK